MSEKGGSRLRSIRIPEAVAQQLEVEARARKTNVNAVIASALARHAEWDRYVERFGFVSLPQGSLLALLDQVEPRDLARLGKELGARIPQQVILFGHRKVTVDTFLDYLSMICRYAGYAEYELRRGPDGHVVTLHHRLGDRWSTFLGQYFEEAIRTCLHVVPRLRLDPESVVLEFRV